MKSTFKIFLFLIVLGTLLGGCGSDDEGQDPQPEPEEPEETTFTVSVAGSATQEVETDIDDNVLDLSFVVATEETEETTGDIAVTVAADADLLETFNTENETEYLLLPEVSYTLAESATISAGENEVEFSVAIDDKNQLEGWKTYLLPVSIESAEGAEINENDKTVYFVITTNYPEYDRTNWTVVEVSSEEPVEADYGHGGLASSTLDGDPETFWHTQWAGGTGEPPHYFIVDMQEARALHGFNLLGRQDSDEEERDGRVREITISVSNDNETYTEAGVIGDIANTRGEITVLLPESTEPVRYFKFHVSSWYGDDTGNPYAHLAELEVF